MALRGHTTVDSDELEGWKILGSGGFGRVYKARHKKDMFDVAIKLLDVDVRCSSSSLALKETELSNEVNNMDQVSGPFVLRVCGIFEGKPPFEGYPSKTKGIVMEYMPEGSLETLQENLGGPPPEALAFRLAYQVALGMNFLHRRELVHQDLKPSNVLLTEDFHAKLADFGLSRVSISEKASNRQTTGDVGGTYKYMPPEALLNISYEPRRKFDIYSYGIFLWSLFTGKEPYPGARRDLVVFAVGKNGQRPPCDDLRQRNVEGLENLVHLMNRCWAHTPSERPKSHVCVEDTESIYTMHKERIAEAVSAVRNALSNQSVPPPDQSQPYDEVDQPAGFSTQPSDSDSDETMSIEDKVSFVEDNRPEIIQKTKEENVMKIVDKLKAMDMVPSELYTEIRVTPKHQDKIRTLYDNSLRSSDFIKAAFYTALKKHEPELVKKLGGS